jgi:two-component system cell cycle response regulator
MDAKANTHICVSPVTQLETQKKVTALHSAYMLVVSGGIPGTMVRLSEQGTSLGRSGENSFQISDITVSRDHAVVMIDEMGTVQIRDEGSTNGTFLNGKRIHAHRLVDLADGDRVQLGTSIVFKLVRLDPNDEQFQRDMYERTVRDTLTGLYNRAYLLNQIGVLAERSASQGIGLAVLMLDIDHFKQINDRYGHLAGDDVLRQVAAVIRESTRSEDLVARFGGEEFVVVLPVSVPDLAADRAERIRSILAERTVMAEGTGIRVTASIGLAFAPAGRSRNEMALIMTADEALYRAKADGRNRVVFGHRAMQLARRQTESAEFAVVFSQ